MEVQEDILQVMMVLDRSKINGINTILLLSITIMTIITVMGIPTIMVNMVMVMVMMAGETTLGITTTGVGRVPTVLGIMAEEDSILMAGGITTTIMVEGRWGSTSRSTTMIKVDGVVVDGKVGIMILVKEEDIKVIKMEDVTMDIARWRSVITMGIASRGTIVRTRSIKKGRMGDPNMKLARIRCRHIVITTE